MQPYVSNGLRAVALITGIAATSAMPIPGEQPNPNYSRFDRGAVTCHENRDMEVTDSYVASFGAQDKWLGKKVRRVSCEVTGLGRDYTSVTFDGQLVEFKYRDPNHKDPRTGETVRVTIFEQPLGASESRRIAERGILLVSADSADAREMADLHRASVESAMKPEYCAKGCGKK